MAGRTILFSLIFTVAMIETNFACAWLWENTFPGWLYLNTDDGDGGGYFEPGGWVGNDEGFPVITVSQVFPASINDPDELKAGWTVKRLLVLWQCMFGSTVIVSAGLGLLPWFNLASIRMGHAKLSKRFG